MQHKELHEAHQRQTKRRQITCFLSDKEDVNEHKTGILHKATVYMEQNLHSRPSHDSDSEVKIRNFFGRVLQSCEGKFGTYFNMLAQRYTFAQMGLDYIHLHFQIIQEEETAKCSAWAIA